MADRGRAALKDDLPAGIIGFSSSQIEPRSGSHPIALNRHSGRCIAAAGAIANPQRRALSDAIGTIAGFLLHLQRSLINPNGAGDRARSRQCQRAGTSLGKPLGAGNHRADGSRRVHGDGWRGTCDAQCHRPARSGVQCPSVLGRIQVVKQHGSNGFRPIQRNRAIRG